MSAGRLNKVLKLEILKPAEGMTWDELGTLLRAVRYRVYRLSNLAISERYRAFADWRAGRADESTARKLSELNKELLGFLKQEPAFDEGLQERIAKQASLPANVTDAIAQYKLQALTSKSKWQDVVRGKTSLPTFRLDIAIPIRCDKPSQRRLERAENGDVMLDLSCCISPYPRIVLKTAKLDGSARAILDRLLENKAQGDEGYRQRFFEVKEDRVKKGRWWLHVSYDFPSPQVERRKDIVVGVDLGFSVPLYAAISNGHARLGRRQFGALAHRIRHLQRQVISRRRSIQAGGKAMTTEETARSGHGRKRRLRPTEALQGRIDNAYTTLNHQLSSAVIKFAADHGAGIIQIEDLAGLQDVLSGTFLGERWRYHQLQTYLEYKCEEHGIELRRVDPRYTSRRCSECGFIHVEFSREHRDRSGGGGYIVRFQCPKCAYEADPDYNAARNLACLDVRDRIAAQCEYQGIKSND